MINAGLYTAAHKLLCSSIASYCIVYGNLLSQNKENGIIFFLLVSFIVDLFVYLFVYLFVDSFFIENASKLNALLLELRKHRDPVWSTVEDVSCNTIIYFILFFIYDDLLMTAFFILLNLFRNNKKIFFSLLFRFTVLI